MGIKNRSGALLLMLLVILVGIGLSAMVVIPEQTTITLREKELSLSQNLGGMRNSIALERIASSSSLFYGNFENRAELVAYLDDLVAKGYLGKIPKDPFCSESQWGTNPGQKFWMPTRNLLGSSSFEAGDFTITPWVVDETNVAVVFNADEWPGKETGSYDHFPYQNRFGTIIGFSGKSLAITQK